MHRFFYPHFESAGSGFHPCFGSSLAGSLLGAWMAATCGGDSLQSCVNGLTPAETPPVVCLAAALALPMLLWATEFFPARRLLILLLTGLQSLGLCFCLSGCVLVLGVSGLALGLRIFWPMMVSHALCCYYAIGVYNGTKGRCFSDALVIGLGCWVFFFLSCFWNKII